MNNDIEITSDKLFKKYYVFFSSILRLNKAWFICSIIIPALLVIVFSFSYLSKSFVNEYMRWTIPSGAEGTTGWLSQIFDIQQIFAVVFFGLFYFSVFISTVLFAYFLFFQQLRNKSYRYALYSGLTRGEVFFILFFTLFTYVLFNAAIVLSIVGFIDFPIYQSKAIACWEIFNIYLNIFIFTSTFILVGYFLWNRSQTLYVVLFTISAFIYILLMAIIREDYLILYLLTYANNKYPGKILVIWQTKLPAGFLNTLRYMPFITSCMTSYATTSAAKYINLFYFLTLNSIIVAIIYFKNKKVPL